MKTQLHKKSKERERRAEEFEKTKQNSGERTRGERERRTEAEFKEKVDLNPLHESTSSFSHGLWT